MDKLKQQVARARRRLNVQQLLGALPWFWFGALLAAAVAIGVQKWFLPGIDDWRRAAWWLGGAAVVGFLAAIVWTWIVRRGELDSAMEIDRRLGLKERVSSSLVLTAEELKSPCGQALVEDTAGRISRLNVAARFPVTISRRMLLPLAPAAVAAALCWLPGPTYFSRASADVDRSIASKQIQESIKPLAKKVEERSKRAKENGLSKVAELLKKIAEEIQSLARKDEIDRHETLAKLHDLTQELDQRGEQLADGAKIRQYLAAMKGAFSGAADKLAQELKNGNFENALAEVKRLQDQLAHGQLDPQQQTELAQQLEAASKALRKIVEQQQNILDKLLEQLAAARQAGDRQAREELERQLARVEKQQSLTDTIKQFADQLAECAKCAQAHHPAETNSALKQLAVQLGQMQQQAQEAALLEATLSEIDGAKLAMSGKQGGAEGSADFPNRIGGTEGVGHRQGGAGIASAPLRVETYDSAVRQQPSAHGSEVSVGRADGPNLKGKALEQIKAQMQAARTESAEPVSAEALPRAQRDHVQQYFDAFRSGQ